jgi:predicted Zn-dependent peptidase
MHAPMLAGELDKGRALAEQATIEAFSDGNVTAQELADLLTHGVPLDFWSKLPASLASLTVPSLTKIAQRLFLPPDQLTIVVVGDRKTVEPPLRLLPFVKSIEFRDAEGRVLH